MVSENQMLGASTHSSMDINVTTIRLGNNFIFTFLKWVNIGNIVNLKLITSSESF